MEGFKNTWVEGVHYDVIPQSEISKINKKISEDSTLNVNYKPERMYSEEEVKTLIDIINWYDDNSDVRPNFEIPEIKKGIALIDWFIDFEEQFKKK